VIEISGIMVLVILFLLFFLNIHLSTFILVLYVSLLLKVLDWYSKPSGRRI